MIKINELSKTIRGTRVLNNVSFDVPKGRAIGLEGPNGSGKTMLMRCVAGLVRPTRGTIFIEGSQLYKEISFPPSVGLLIENPAFLSNRTGMENLMILSSVDGVPSVKNLGKQIEAVGLDPTDRRNFRKYSLGMKQRLGLAAAFMEQPDILLLDEPTNALDAEGISLFKDLFFDHKTRGAAIIVSCHDKGLLRELADEVYVMNEGEVIGHEICA